MGGEQAIRSRTRQVSERVRRRIQKRASVEIRNGARVQRVTSAVVAIDAHRTGKRGVVTRDASAGNTWQIASTGDAQRQSGTERNDTGDHPVTDKTFHKAVAVAKIVTRAERQVVDNSAMENVTVIDGSKGLI